jgi:hypothetical protein
MTRFGFFGRLAAGVGAAVAAPVARALAPVAPAIQPLGPAAVGVGRVATATLSGSWVGAAAEANAGVGTFTFVSGEAFSPAAFAEMADAAAGEPVVARVGTQIP